MKTPPFLIVAIDGGAAAGKSSTAHALSARFHFLHADTGSYYRALTSELLHRGVKATDPESVRAELADLKFDTQIVARDARMKIHGDRVSETDIRSEAVNHAVSHFAALPDLRSALLAYQRSLADLARANQFSGLVMEGRDIGTVIFPKADFRIFLHADPDERVRRREREGQTDAVAERDRLDSSRAAAPLTCPAGALAIDSTHLPLNEVVERIARLITARLLGP